MEKSTTLESKAKTRNGVVRMVFSIVAIVLEVVLIFFLLTKLQEQAAWIDIVLHLLGLVLVLVIYAMDTTSSMKMPWIILILTMPILGTVLYLLVGMNGGTRKMRERYEILDRRLLPLISGKDGETNRLLRETDQSAAGICSYLRVQSGYPVWKNTDVEYYDDAAKGLEAQLADLEKAEQFIFMEYHAIEDKTSWNRIEDVLARKAAQGVEVRVFYDDMGSIGFINVDFTKKLENRGIACRVFNPFIPFLNLFLNNRDLCLFR